MIAHLDRKKHTVWRKAASNHAVQWTCLNQLDLFMHLLCSTPTSHTHAHTPTQPIDAESLLRLFKNQKSFNITTLLVICPISSGLLVCLLYTWTMAFSDCFGVGRIKIGTNWATTAKQLYRGISMVLCNL